MPVIQAGPLLLLVSAAGLGHQAAGRIAKPSTPILGFSTCRITDGHTGSCSPVNFPAGPWTDPAPPLSDPTRRCRGARDIAPAGNCFQGNIDETTLIAVADAMVASGLVELGYNYLNIDDEWAADQRNATGGIEVDHTKFPSGMPSLASYLNQRKMKLGLCQ